MNVERPTPPVSDERVDQLWREAAPWVLTRERTRRTRRRVATVAVAVLAVVGASAWLSARAPAPVTLSAGQVAQGPRHVRLADDSRVALEASAAVTLEADGPDELRLALRSGRARFEVSKQHQRTFHVVARGVDVRVVGTRFLVEDLGDAVLVSVDEGVVEVKGQEDTRKLTAGQSWRVAATRVVATPASPVSPAAPVPEALPEPELAPSSPQARPVTSPATPPRRTAARPTAVAPAPTPTAGPAVEQAPDADAVFNDALEARRAGRSREATAAWERFLYAYPRDPRAGLAAFELGRLEMDVNHHPAAALGALERALATAPAASFAEDALARVVQLHHAAGDRAACQASRERYLERYPAGSHAATLASLCR
jgi:TolA-binding protein